MFSGVSLGVIHFLKVGVVADGFDPLLEGNHLVIADHHGYVTVVRLLLFLFSIESETWEFEIICRVEKCYRLPRVIHLFCGLPQMVRGRTFT